MNVNPNFMDFLNILSIVLQLQNTESMCLDRAQASIEDKIDNEIDKKLNIILQRLDRIEQKLDKNT